jgi:nucleoside-diphosphate-sugar epimerase
MDITRPFEEKHVLITGGLGFIGSNLARRLVAAGARVRIVDVDDPATGANSFNLDGILDQVELRIADLREDAVIQNMLPGQDFLFNLAGQVSHAASMEDPLDDLQINAGCQLAIVEACRRHNLGIKIVFAGTRQVYGRPRSLPVDESHPVDPVDYNGISKRAGELYHLVAQRVYGLRTCSLRMTNVYGPRMRCRDGRQTFLGLWIRRLIEGRPIPVYGSGAQIRDLNFAEDVVDALLLAAASPSSDGQVYNLGSPEPMRLIDLADLMIAVAGGGSRELLPFPEERRRIDIGDYHGDYRKIQGQLGWQPQVTLRDGLARTIAYYRQNREHYW